MTVDNSLKNDDSADPGAVRSDSRGESLRAGPAQARFSSAQAMAAAAPAVFAPAAALALALSGTADSAAGLLTVIVAAIGSAPLVAIAAIGGSRPLTGGAFALACLPIALAGALAAWLGGGVLSPAGPWIFAALAAAAMLGGVRWALGAAALGLALGLLLVVAPEPPLRLGGFAARGDRELAATLSWAAALASLAAVAWAALSAWAEALPPLRHPTIAARRSLAALAETSGVCALRIDSRGRIVQALGSVEETLEMPKRALIGLTLGDLAHPDDRDALKNLLRDEQRAERARRARKTAPEGAEGTAAGEQDSSEAKDGLAPTPNAALVLRTRSRFGGYRWLEAMAAPASGFPPPVMPEKKPQGSEGEAATTAAASSGDDMMLTLRVRWRSEREIGRGGDARDAELLAHVNSALRERLKSVVGYTEILKNELFGPIGSPRYRDYARRAHEDGADLLELVDELLDLAEIEAGRYGAQMELVDPVPIVDGALRLMSARAERAGVELVAETPPNTPYVRVDRRALRRVLINMLIDAMRSAEMGDKLTLRTKAEEGAIEFQLATTRSAIAPPSLDENAALSANGDAGAGTDGAGGNGVDRTAPGAPALPAPDGVATAIEQEADANDARLGRMIASNLAERLGGSLVFAAELNSAPSAPGIERLYAEAILPLGAPPKRESAEDDDAADETAKRRRGPSLWGTEDEPGRAKAREAAEERDLARPLFDFDDTRAQRANRAGRAGKPAPEALPAPQPNSSPTPQPTPQPAPWAKTGSDD